MSPAGAVSCMLAVSSLVGFAGFSSGCASISFGARELPVCSQDCLGDLHGPPQSDKLSCADRDV